MVEVYVGTSGWVYDWNEGGDLRWYVEHSGLNAVELNASFYRFPFPAQVKSWASKGVVLRWAVKVHRSITHVRRLTASALDVWARFRERFAPLDPLVDFYLLQLPPSFTATREAEERLRSFASSASLGSRLAVEFRHESWFEGRGLKLCEELGATFVSVDSPMGTFVGSSNGIVYLRLHGRGAWYAYDYGEDELRELARSVLALSPESVYVFFNNDHWMLGNARTMLALLRGLARGQQCYIRRLHDPPCSSAWRSFEASSSGRPSRGSRRASKSTWRATGGGWEPFSPGKSC